jgi:cytidine deaminase
MKSCTYTTNLDYISFLYSTLPNLYKKLIYHTNLSSRLSTTRYSVGSSLLLDSGDVIFGYNSHKTHPLQKKYTANPSKIFLHAEVHALAKYRQRRIVDAIKLIIVTRTTRKGNEQAGSRPCDGCLSCIMAFDVEKLLFYEDNTWKLVALRQSS